MEVDVVMNANTPLWKAHDISQQLQDRIEVLPNVERAFVHVDHETDHIPVRYFCAHPSSYSNTLILLGTSKRTMKYFSYDIRGMTQTELIGGWARPKWL